MVIVKAVCNEWAGEITVRLVKFMVSELSIPLHSFTRDLSHRVLELYSEMDRQTAEFRTATGLRCLPGCGQCCESATPEVTVIELLPAAGELFSRGEAQQWLERIASVGETGRCIFFQPDPLIPGNGHCELYMFRPSVCQLFAFAAVKNKNRKPELVTCRCQKEQIPLLVKGAQEAISAGMAVPSFDYFSLKMVALEPSLGRQRVPINQALHLALGRYGLTVQLMEANGPRQRDWER
jgi:Fe-S-cluster containining protein